MKNVYIVKKDGVIVAQGQLADVAFMLNLSPSYVRRAWKSNSLIKGKFRVYRRPVKYYLFDLKGNIVKTGNINEIGKFVNYPPARITDFEYKRKKIRCKYYVVKEDVDELD